VGRVYDGVNGWRSVRRRRGRPGRRDELEASALVRAAGQVGGAAVSTDRDADGVPLGWVERIRHTALARPKVQAERMVREYVSELYVPAALASRRWTPTGSGPRRNWPPGRSRGAGLAAAAIDHVESDASGQRLGSALVVRVSVALGELTPDDVTVEVVYGHPTTTTRSPRPPTGADPGGEEPPRSLSAGHSLQTVLRRGTIPPDGYSAGDDPPSPPWSRGAAHLPVPPYPVPPEGCALFR